MTFPSEAPARVRPVSLSCMYCHRVCGYVHVAATDVPELLRALVPDLLTRVREIPFICPECFDAKR